MVFIYRFTSLLSINVLRSIPHFQLILGGIEPWVVL